MLIWTGLTLLVLGVIVWLFGDRLWLMAAGAGALLGIGLLRFFPGMADGFTGFLVVVGLAVALGVLGFIGKAFKDYRCCHRLYCRRRHCLGFLGHVRHQLGVHGLDRRPDWRWGRSPPFLALF